MVFVGTYFEKVDLITIGYTQARLLDYQIYVLVNDDSSVLGRTDQVIDENTDVMTLVDVDAHGLQYTRFSCFAGEQDSAASRGEFTRKEIQEFNAPFPCRAGVLVVCWRG